MFREKEQLKLQMFFTRSWISVKYNLLMPQRKKMTSPGKKSHIWTRWIQAGAPLFFLNNLQKEKLFLWQDMTRNVDFNNSGENMQEYKIL